jgi:hypothetical protein
LNDTGGNNTGVHDVALVSLNGGVNNIKLETSEGVLVANETPLLCGQNYRVIITVENLGNFNEDITFNGSVGDVSFAHLAVSDFVPGQRSTKTRTVNFNLLEGTYDLIVESMSNNVDAVPENNRAVRSVFVDC